jgi:DNA-binding GntR family transcriptional regulator
MIRQSHNLEGILQTTIDCIDHQHRILDAYERMNYEAARETARNFLKKMKEYLGTRLPPASSV